MTEIEFDKLVNNQKILDRKLDTILDKLNTVISNQNIIEQYHLDTKRKLEHLDKRLK